MANLSNLVFLLSLLFVGTLSTSLSSRTLVHALTKTTFCSSLSMSATSFNTSVQNDPAAHPSTEATFLGLPTSCKDNNLKFTLTNESDGSSLWSFAKFRSENDTFAIWNPSSLCPSNYLAVSVACDDLYVTSINKAECEAFSYVWVVKPVSNRIGYFTLTNYHRKQGECSKTLLSVGYDDGSLYLTDVDDGSGRQHWLLPQVPADEDMSRLNDVTSKNSTKPSGRKSRFF